MSKYPMRETPLFTDKGFYRFNAFPKAISAFSGRRLGNMSLSYADTVNSINNRKDFLKGSGLNYRDLVCAKQVHASAIRYVQEKDRGKGAESYDTSLDDTDGLITDKKNLPLAIFTADCLSIFLYDRRTPAIGLVHAGWRSTKEEIAVKSIKLMSRYFNSQPQDLCAAFGPCIRSCCYEVGEEFREFFPEGVAQRGGRHYLDLAAVNKKQLLGSLVKEENIFDPGFCTSCNNEELFSYRKEGESCGRLMSVIMLK